MKYFITIETIQFVQTLLYTPSCNNVIFVISLEERNVIQKNELHKEEK
jgi:hypothetical protein